MAGLHAGQVGSRCADHAAAAIRELGQIPKRGRLRGQVRVVRQQRLAGSCARAAQHPGVAAAPVCADAGLLGYRAVQG